MSETSRRLKELRTASGLSQGEVARQIGVTRTAYVKYETGDSKPVRKLDELSRLFSVTTDYLLGREKEPEMSAEETNLLAGYRRLPPENKTLILNLVGQLNK